MTLYHVTKKENLPNIKECGLCPKNQEESNYTTHEDETLIGEDVEGLFFFTDYDSAENFCIDNGGEENIILKINKELNTILDPEYDGESVFFETSEYLIVEFEEIELNG